MSYEGSDDEEELETVPIFNQNNDNYSVVSDSKSESDDKSAKNFYNKNMHQEVEGTPKPPSMLKQFFQ